MLGVTPRWTNILSRGGGGVEILPVASCYRNRDKLRPDESPGYQVWSSKRDINKCPKCLCEKNEQVFFE